MKIENITLEEKCELQKTLAQVLEAIRKATKKFERSRTMRPSERAMTLGQLERRRQILAATLAAVEAAA